MVAHRDPGRKLLVVRQPHALHEHHAVNLGRTAFLLRGDAEFHAAELARECGHVVGDVDGQLVRLQALDARLEVVGDGLELAAKRSRLEDGFQHADGCASIDKIGAAAERVVQEACGVGVVHV